MRIAIAGAGGPAGVNVCRALHAAGHQVLGFDSNELHLEFCREWCERVDTNGFLEADADLFHSQVDSHLPTLARRDDLPIFMPSPGIIYACQDKHATGRAWAAGRLKRHNPVAISEPGVPDMLHVAAEELGLPFWLRASRGAGARAATLVEELAAGYHWIRYWQTVGAGIEWIAEEYLPGRDYCWTSLWHRGELVAAFTRERLEWIYPQLAPTGRTGTPTAAVTVHQKEVAVIAQVSVLEIDPSPHGIYAVDLREDIEGVPRPTEINAGRWPTTSPIYSELGVNLPDLHARLAGGQRIDPIGDDIYPAGVTLLRHIDCPTRILTPA